MDQIQKVFHTALIVQPPVQCTQQIQQIRMNHDKAYDRWMPHVNVCFPFVDPLKFDEVHNKLQEHFKEIEAFEITLREFNYFDHGKNCVMWLKPESQGNRVQMIQSEIVKLYPFLNDLAQKGNGYTPHLTVGQFAKKAIDARKQELTHQFNPQTFLCKELHMIARDGVNNPFKIIKSIKLKCDQQVDYQYMG